MYFNNSSLALSQLLFWCSVKWFQTSCNILPIHCNFILLFTSLRFDWEFQTNFTVADEAYMLILSAFYLGELWSAGISTGHGYLAFVLLFKRHFQLFFILLSHFLFNTLQLSLILSITDNLQDPNMIICIKNINRTKNQLQDFNVDFNVPL